MDIVKEITEAYRAKKARWDALIRIYTELPATERREVVAKLILLEEDDAQIHSQVRPSNGNATGQPGEKPKLLELVRRALHDAGRPMSAPEIFAYARTLRSDIRKNSIETTVSKAAQRGFLKKVGMSETGLKLYAQP